MATMMKKLDRYIETIGSTVGEELIKPTRIYVKQF